MEHVLHLRNAQTRVVPLMEAVQQGKMNFRNIFYGINQNQALFCFFILKLILFSDSVFVVYSRYQPLVQQLHRIVLTLETQIILITTDQLLPLVTPFKNATQVSWQT